jgi:hypothetical protein
MSILSQWWAVFMFVKRRLYHAVFNVQKSHDGSPLAAEKHVRRDKGNSSSSVCVSVCVTSPTLGHKHFFQKNPRRIHDIVLGFVIGVR